MNRTCQQKRLRNWLFERNQWALTCTNSEQLRAPTVCWWAPHHRSGNRSSGRPCTGESEARTPARQWSCHPRGELPLFSHTRRHRVVVKGTEKVLNNFHHIWQTCVSTWTFVLVSVSISLPAAPTISSTTSSLMVCGERSGDTWTHPSSYLCSTSPLCSPTLPLPSLFLLTLSASSHSNLTSWCQVSTRIYSLIRLLFSCLPTPAPSCHKPCGYVICAPYLCKPRPACI